MLILDEINRADLSRLFGEAFSALELEKRGEPIDLSVEDPETEKPRQLAIPPKLFVIGTMNLIDQSVEQIDFAMRRRFLWQESRFDQGTLLTVLEERWREEDRKQTWEKVEPDMQLLAEAASRLNNRNREHRGARRAIRDRSHLSVRHREASGRRHNSASDDLSSGRAKGEPKDPVRQLWDLALKPLLTEYLAGLEAERKKELIAELWTAFTRR